MLCYITRSIIITLTIITIFFSISLSLSFSIYLSLTHIHKHKMWMKGNPKNMVCFITTRFAVVLVSFKLLSFPSKVFEAEKRTAKTGLYHRRCFSCFECKRALDYQVSLVNQFQIRTFWCCPWVNFNSILRANSFFRHCVWHKCTNLEQPARICRYNYAIVST